LLRLDRISKSYGAIAAVRNVSFTAAPGDVIGYLGPNGSGKTTTAKMIAGLLEPRSGTVSFDGHDIREHPLEHRRRVGYVPESPELYTYLSGPEYLTLVGRLRRIHERKLVEKIERFLHLFDVYDERYAPMSAYSKGMRQKISIASALLHDPALVIFDEPSSGLDVGSTLVLRELVRTLAREGKTILYSSHVLELTEQVCSSILILREGEVVASDSVSRLRDLMRQPSLEGVFTQLTRQPDPARTASEIIEAMRL
jgi:ABC-2 type transport system ATP-binding protein